MEYPRRVYNSQPQSLTAEQWPPGKNSTGGPAASTRATSTSPSAVETISIRAMGHILS